MTTTTAHNLGSTDVVRINGTTVGGYNATYATNSLSIVSGTVFEIVPFANVPVYSSNATGGTLQILKEDTIVLGTLQVKPRITSL